MKKSSVIFMFIGIFFISIFYKFVWKTDNLKINNYKDTVFIVDGISMQPMLKNREKVVVHLGYYNNTGNKVNNGDVVIFKNGITGQQYIKKVLIVPGDYILINKIKRTIFVNNKQISNSEGKYYTYNDFAIKTIENYTNSNGQWKQGIYFLFGDNTSNSIDSRTFGPVSIGAIIGKVIIL